jgi:hypothetical protein
MATATQVADNVSPNEREAVAHSRTFVQGKIVKTLSHGFTSGVVRSSNWDACTGRKSACVSTLERKY